MPIKTIADLQKKYTQRLDSLDLELLIAHTLKKPREFVLAHPEYELPPLKIVNCKLKISRRMRGEPLAYILGSKEFFGLPFLVTRATLIPRPETELMVEEALEEVKSHQSSVISIIDVGTGSGNIIISIAKSLESLCHPRVGGDPVTHHKVSTLDSRMHENDNYTFYAIDISVEALRVARRNAKKNNVTEKIKFLHGNLLEPILRKNNFEIENSIITANLPYLDSDWKNLLKSSDTKGLKYEPDIALYSGCDGLDSYRELAEQLKKSSLKNVVLLCEIGYLQASGMKKIFSFANKISFKKDLAGRTRIAIISL